MSVPWRSSQGLLDADYKIKKRNLLEDLLDIETDTFPPKMGIFYPDPDGNVFGNVLFHTAEWTLTGLDLLLFCFVDHFAQNLVLAAICVYIVSKACACGLPLALCSSHLLSSLALR